MSTQDAHSPGITVSDLVSGMLSGKWYILGSFGLVLFLISYYTFNQAPVYQASSLILINNESQTPQLGELLGLQRGNRNVANEIEIIRSRTIALRVADALIDWQMVPGTATKLTVLGGGSELTSSQLDVANNLLGQYISVSPVNPDVDLIEITARSTVPREAALIADMYADEFLEYNRAQSRRRFAIGREFLEEQTQNLDTLLGNAESNILSFTQQSDIVDPDAEASALLTQVMELEAEHYRTEFEIRAAQSELQTLESEMDRILPGLSRALNSYEDEQLMALRARIAQYQVQNAEKVALTPELLTNPGLDEDYQENQRRIESFTDELAQLSVAYTDQVIDEGGLTLGSDSKSALTKLGELESQLIEKRIALTGAQAKMDVLDNQLAIYRDEIRDIPNKSVLLARLQRDMETSAQLYTTIFQSLQEARIAEASELGYVDKIDQAIVPTSPISPRIPRNLFLGAILGILSGVSISVTRSLLDNKISRPEELRQRGISVVGIIPDLSATIQSDFGGKQHIDVDGRSIDTALIPLFNPLSQTAEAYRRLRTNVDFSIPDKDNKVVVVTSAEPGEGKTSSALNLSIVNAQLGRSTLFIDADLRRPASHKMMGISRTPGLVDWLFEVESSSLDDLKTHVDNLSVMTVGRAAPNPSELLGSKKMGSLLQRFRDQYDTVIIDTPPILSVSDALLVAMNADMVLQIISCGETNWAAFNRSLEILNDAGIDISGVILNRFDAKKAYGGYGYGAGSSYGYGYGYGYGSDGEIYADQDMQQVIHSNRAR